MESKRTILNNILRIVSAEEARNQALVEEIITLRKEIAEFRSERKEIVSNERILVGMMRELINEVKKLHTPFTKPIEKQPIPVAPSLTNDVVKARRISTREKDLFSNTKTHYDYRGIEKTVGQAKAVKILKAEGFNLGEKPFRFLHRLVKDLGVAEIPTKAKNAKSGNYRLYMKDLQKVRDYLR